MICRSSRLGRVVALALAAGLQLGAGAARAAGGEDADLVRLESSAVAEPENLWLAAVYRQKAIQLGAFDRAIKTFERLASRREAGPNVFISLSLAYVDKVPTVSPLRRIFVGHDASAAINKSIDRRPSLVAYYIRGVIALFYPEGVFHRGRQGVADLQRARELASSEPERLYHARVYLSLGDGYWRIGDVAQARSMWAEGVKRFPDDPALRARLTTEVRELDGLVSHALDSGTRVDTSLRELFPE